MKKENNNKFIFEEHANNFTCMLTPKKCNGSNCPAWKWTGGYTTENLTCAALQLFHHTTKLANNIIKTHGCCGMVYRGEIKLIELAK